MPNGCGSIISFGIRGGRAAGRRFIETLRVFSHLANVGDAKSLVIHPASTTHQQMDADALKVAGVGEEMVRLSIGLEDAGDLIDDLGQALRASQSRRPETGGFRGRRPDRSSPPPAARRSSPTLPSVIFIHGAGMDHTVWTLQTRFFAHHGRNVLALDLPGHGRSEGPALDLDRRAGRLGRPRARCASGCRRRRWSAIAWAR